MGLYLLTPDKVCEVLIFGTEDRPGSAKWSAGVNLGLYTWLLHIKFYWDAVKLFVYKLSKAIVIQQEQGWAIATETLPLAKSIVFTNFYRKS